MDFKAFPFVQKFLCACLQCVFAVCYFCTFPKCCDEKDRDCPAGTLWTIQPILPSFPEKKKKTEYILVPALATVAILLLLLLYDSFIHGEGDLWDVSSFVFVLLRSFVRLVVCMFSFFSVSLCQSTNTDTCSCATEILWLITWSDSRSVCGRKNPLKGSFTKLWRINIHIYIKQKKRKKERKKVETQIKLRNTDDWRGTFLIDQSLLMWDSVQKK